MKSKFIRTVSASFLCLCALTALSGCIQSYIDGVIRDAQRQGQENLRQHQEQQQLRLAQQLEQQKNIAAQLAPHKIVADSVSELAEKAMNEFKLRNDIVIVMFVTENDVSATLSKVKETMHTRDQHGVMNPYWVVGFPGEAVDTETHCGVVVGQWYDGDEFPSRAPWERIMDGVLAREVISGTYLYSHKGEFRLTQGGQSQMDSLQEICFVGSELAASNFNSFGAGAGKNGPNMSRPMPQLVPDPLIQGQTTTKDLAAMKLKGDTFVGSACGKTLGLEVNISDVFLNDPKAQNEPLFLVRGSMEVAHTSHTSLPIALVGGISRTNGILSLTASSADWHPLYKHAIISLFRDDEGIGWEGMIEGIDGNDCDDVRFTSKNGNRLNAFPNMTGDVAFHLSNPKMAPNSSLYPLYWLKVAEARGSTDATYYLGELYEQRGMKSPHGYVLAFQYYQAATHSKDDARAQAALGRMYRKGLGTAVDAVKAKQWSDLARKTRQSAERTCRSPKLRDAIGRYSAKLDGRKQKLAEGVKAVTGSKIDVGAATIGQVTAEEVISLTMPFLCRATGGFDNPNFQMKMPDDRSSPLMDQFAAKATERIVEDRFRNTRYYFTLRLDPLGNGRYNVIHQGISGIESEVLNLN